MQTHSYIPIQTDALKNYPSIKSSDLQRKVGQVLKRVAVGREWLVVEREGYPVAVMFPYPDLEQLKREQAAQKMRVLLSTMGTNEYSEAEVDADIAKAISEVRHEKRQKNKKT